MGVGGEALAAARDGVSLDISPPATPWFTSLKSEDCESQNVRSKRAGEVHPGAECIK